MKCEMCEAVEAEAIYAWNTDPERHRQGHKLCRPCGMKVWEATRRTVCRDLFSIRPCSHEEQR
jgi:hypothetical protein